MGKMSELAIDQHNAGGLTPEELAALVSQVRHYAEHFAKKADAALSDYFETYYKGKSNGFKMLLEWLETDLYHSMVNLDTDTEAAKWLSEGHG